MKKLALVVLFVVAGLSCLAVGQKYVTDSFQGNPTRLYEPTAERGSDKVQGCNPDKYIEVPAGEELILSSDKWHYNYDYAYVLYNGKEYAVRCREIRFVEDNAAGEGNVLQEWNIALSHSDYGHWYQTRTPFILIAIFAAIAALLAFCARKVPSKFLLVSTALLLGVVIIAMTALEIGVICCLQENLWMWWVDVDAGYFKTILVLIAMLLVFVSQLYGGSTIRDIVMVLKDKYVIFKTFFLGLIPIPVTFITLLVFAFCNNQGPAMELTCELILGVGTGLFLLYFWIANRGAGFIGGLLYSIFGFIYALGATLLAIFFVVAVIKFIVKMLIAIGTVVLCLYIAMKFGPKGGGYTDVRGGYHETKDAKDFANQQIYDAERKKNEE